LACEETLDKGKQENGIPLLEINNSSPSIPSEQSQFSSGFEYGFVGRKSRNYF
jgi:hypothetical protein